ncbi:uncharacterized protein [Ptychodera flava]|uniref:uncharacterized protein isoform X1 n=1 Tax=Ptychodera flava TaxID=63121 RepID=UPI00396A2CC0
MDYETIPGINDSDGRIEQQRNAPFITRFSLAFLGFPFESAKLRRCINHIKMAPSLGDNSQDASCAICESVAPLPRYKGTPRLWKRQRIGYVIWLAFLATLSTVCLSHKIYHRWGNEHFTLYIMSYCSFMGPVAAIALYRLVAFFTPCPPDGTRAIYALTNSHVVGLLKRSDVSNSIWAGYLYHLSASVCLFLNISFELHHVFTDCPSLDGWGLFYFVTETFAFFTFSSFWYVTLLMRRAMQADMKKVARFLEETHNNNALCRQRIMETFVEFSRLNSFMSGWIVLLVNVNAFKLSCHLFWNYVIYSEQSHLASATLINMLISVEVLTYFILPFFAVGWFNIDYIWKNFMAHVEYLQSENEYWPCFKMIKHLQPAVNNVTITLVFSVLTVFLSLQFTTQYAEYWDEDSVCHTVSAIYNITTGKI